MIKTNISSGSYTIELFWIAAIDFPLQLLVRLATSNLTTSTSGNQTLILDLNLCTLQICDLTLASSSYIPNLAGNTLCFAMFAMLFFIQLAPGIRY